MPTDTFATPRLTCRPPGHDSAEIYRALFLDRGDDLLAVDITEWERHGVAPCGLGHGFLRQS